MKACKDCKHCLPINRYSGLKNYEFAKCGRVTESNPLIDMVAGGELRRDSKAHFCSTEREYSTLCGSNARYFEPIEAAEEPLFVEEKPMSIFERMGLPKIKFPKIRIVK